MKKCFICEQIAQIRAKKHPRFVAEVDGGYVVLHPYQYFRGYAFLLAPRHVTSFEQMTQGEFRKFMLHAGLLETALKIAFGAPMVNLGKLGNVANHFHWHAIPRYGTDAMPDCPPWNIGKDIREAQTYLASPSEISTLKAQLQQGLKDAGALIIHR